MNTKSTITFAVAAATLLFAGCKSSDDNKSNESGDKAQQTLVKCEGVNECKGKSECKSPTNPNGCQGLNECKGQGYVSIPKEECDEKGGKVFTEVPDTTADTGADADKDTMAASVKCLGINDCKGHSDCAGADNECKGMNDCKGKGFLEVPTEADCTDKGGTVQG